MIKVESSIIVNAPVAKVWEFMSDLGTMTQWDPGVIKVDWQPPVRVGSVALVTAQLLGKRTARWEVTEWEPNRKIGALVKSGGAKVRGTYAMEPAEGNKTRLSRSVQVEVGGLLRLLYPYISYKTKNERSAEIENIKRILEGQDKSS